MKRVKGPKEGTIVEASFDGKSKQEFPHLRTTKDLVLLSIAGNEFCSGVYLSAIIKRSLTDHSFTTFLVADKLYWHNLRSLDDSVQSKPQLVQQALEYGNSYIADNLPVFLGVLGLSVEQFNNQYQYNDMREAIGIINKLALEKNLHFEVLTWDTWLQKGGYDENTQNRLEAFYESNETLKKSIEEEAASYFKRQSNESNKELTLFRSKAYLKEESPAIVWVAAKLGYNFIVYPGEMPKPFESSRQFFVTDRSNTEAGDWLVVHENPKQLANWLEICFTRSYGPRRPQLAAAQAITFFGANGEEVGRGSPPGINVALCLQVTAAAILDNQTLTPAEKELMLRAMINEILKSNQSAQPTVSNALQSK